MWRSGTSIILAKRDKRKDMIYQIGDVVMASTRGEVRVGIIIKSRMWNDEVDYKLIIAGIPGEQIWVLERLIMGKI